VTGHPDSSEMICRRGWLRLVGESALEVVAIFVAACVGVTVLALPFIAIGLTLYLLVMAWRAIG